MHNGGRISTTPANRVLFPASPLFGDAQLDRHLVFMPELANLPLGQLRLYAGQIDPNDESHFTIDCETPAGRGTIDGWLLADDTVKVEVRNGPATAPATQR